MIEPRPDAPAPQGQLSPAAWRLASAAILIGAALLRFYDLELKPLHHDEGVNAWFLTRLVREGVYVYDPRNYHGPTLYYAAQLSAWVLGLGTTALRVSPAVFGTGAVGLTLLFRRWIGDRGALAAAALLAVSPGCVYFSRYFIHEALVVCFTLGLVYGALRYREEKRPIHLLAAATSAGLLFSTKETAIISVAVLAIAYVATGVYVRLATGARAAERATAVGERRAAAFHWLGAAALFLLVTVLFYSSLFSNMVGVADALRTYTFWFETGRGEHVYPWYQYLGVLLQEEAPLLVLGIVGIGAAFLQRRARAAIFLALWALGISAAYTILPYKTPWLVLNFLAPLALVSGWNIEARSRAAPVLTLSVAAAAVAFSLSLSIWLSFFRYDDPLQPYVYAHTRREFLALPRDIDAIALGTGAGGGTSIAVMAPDYWPLPWYLRDFPNIGYFGSVVQTTAGLVIVEPNQEAELTQTVGDAYRRSGSYLLRQGVELVLYVRNDLPTLVH